MSVITGRFVNQRDLKIFYRRWAPDEGDESLGHLVLVHGAAEHSGRHEHFGQRYAKKNFNVWALDLPGLGQSEGVRGHIDDYEHYLDDIGLIIDKARASEPRRPVFLVGFSLGGVLALAYAEKRGRTIDGVVGAEPLLGLKVKVPAYKVIMAKLLAGITPKVALENEIDPELLVHNPLIRQEYIEDPLLYTKVTFRWFVELVRLMKDTNEMASLLGNLPVLLLQGSEDGIVDADLTRTFAAPNREYVEFPGFYHELFNEDERGQVFAILDAWLEKRLADKAPL